MERSNSIPASYVEHFDRDPSLSLVVQDQLETGMFDCPVSHMSLSHLGDSLELPCAKRIENNAHVFRVTREINEHLCVARFYVSGPYGRRVAIGTPEIDLVVFLLVDLKSDKDENLLETPDIVLPGLEKHLSHKFASNPNVQVYPISTTNVYPSNKSMNTCSLSFLSKQKSCDYPPFIPIQYGEARFRIFVAPALASDPEDQRQAAYKLIHRVQMKKGIKEIVRLYPALFERPSEDVACERPEVHSFCRICLYWTRIQDIKTLDLRLIEILALIAARQTLALPVNQRNGTRNSTEIETSASIHEQTKKKFSFETETRTPVYQSNTLDFFTAFITFLHYCASIDHLSHNLTASIQAPCPTNYTLPKHAMCIINDEFNPYWNLAESLSLPDMMYLKKCSQATLKQLDPLTCVDEINPIQPITDPLSSTFPFPSTNQPCVLMKHVFVRQCRAVYNTTQDFTACKGVKGVFTLFGSSKPSLNETTLRHHFSFFLWKFFLLSLVSLGFLSIFYFFNSFDMHDASFATCVQHVSYQLVLLLQQSLLLFFNIYERMQPLFQDYTQFIYNGYQNAFKTVHDFIVSTVKNYMGQ